MRILFLTSIFPQPDNPLRGIFSLYLCRAMASDHKLKIVAPWSWLKQLQFRWDRLRGANASWRVPSDLEVEYPCYYYPPKVLRFAYHWFMWRSMRNRMDSILREFQPECVVSYWAHPDGAVAVTIARRMGIPCAVMIGGSDVLLLVRDSNRKKQIVRVLNAADAVIPVGSHLREAVLSLGIPENKTHIVPRGIDREVFSPGNRIEARRRLGIPQAPRVLVWVGNMVPLKGVDVLLTAFEQLIKTGQSLRLYLIGRGPLRNELMTQCSNRGISEAVCFAGPIEHSALPDWYRAANLTVLPSRSEGVPNVLRESLACGTPFVASRVGGIPELAQDDMCELVPPDDANSLANAIMRALDRSSPSLRNDEVNQTWGQSADQLTAILADLVRQKRRNDESLSVVSKSGIQL